MNRTPYSRWIAGDVLSWALGVTLGVILGVGLLIATPLLMRRAAPVTAATPAASGETAAAAQNTMAGSPTPDSAAPGSSAAGSTGMSGAADTATAPTATGTAPADTAPAAAPAATAAAGDTTAGQTVFASNCAGCHGAAAKGGIGANLTTPDGPKAWNDAQFITALREGKTPQRELSAVMPRFTAAQISDSDLTNIHAWIKSLN